LVLRQELSQAEFSLSHIQSASKSVSDAMRWSGSYGVRISRVYGNDELDKAQMALDNGEYQVAAQYAASAQRVARSAISNAESEVARIKRQRAEAERERRRARNRARQSKNISFGTSSSRSSNRSSARISSGSGSKGSGFSRSGW